ncbi:MAG: hypothetical protein WCF25_08550 [Acidimicrobiales bacterium]
MSSDDTFTQLFEGPSRLRRAWRWFAQPPRSARPLSDRDVLLELHSVDMTVRFFDDRLEYHRRLGAKHGTVPYRSIRVARLVASASLLVKRPASTNVDSSREAKKMVITVDARATPLIFDFRAESSEKVREALLLIDRGLER